jgi:energy-converting hydrogenase Eha subunit B
MKSGPIFLAIRASRGIARHAQKRPGDIVAGAFLGGLPAAGYASLTLLLSATTWSLGG